MGFVIHWHRHIHQSRKQTNTKRKYFINQLCKSKYFIRITHLLSAVDRNKSKSGASSLEKIPSDPHYIIIGLSKSSFIDFITVIWFKSVFNENKEIPDA